MNQNQPAPSLQQSAAEVSLLHELVEYLRENRGDLREQWARRITDAELLSVMTGDEIFSEVTAVYDNYVDALETGSVETLQAYARDLSERIIRRGVETHEVLGIVLLLRDVLGRSLLDNYEEDRDLLRRILDAYEPAANRIAVTVGVSFVEERERVIREQQEAIRDLSTPVLQVRDRLLISPIIGAVDSDRARQLTEQLLGAIKANRAQVVVLDITGVASVDETVANHLVQTVEAARLMGASAVITGVSSKIAQTIVDLGVDLGMLKTVGDLQGGLEEAERMLGYRDARLGGHRKQHRGLARIRDVGRDPTEGRVFHRVDPVGPERPGGPRPTGRLDRARRSLSRPRDRRRRLRLRRHRLLCGPRTAVDCPDGEAARRAHGDRRHPA